ncbi:MAG: paraquat-inducible protein A [Tepidisphaeraceae bacterium]
MSAHRTSPAVNVRCRRCGREYLMPQHRRPWLASCPRCGAAPVPLWRKIGRHNGAGAVLAVFALVVLSASVVLPFISMTQLGSRRVFSLVGGIRELLRGGQWLIGIILLVFSLVFPFAKMIALLAATSSLTRLSAPARRRLHYLAMLTGKYSLLDILVVAIMIVVVKFRGVAEVEALPGTILFCVAIALSIASGAMIDLEDAP